MPFPRPTARRRLRAGAGGAGRGTAVLVVATVLLAAGCTSGRTEGSRSQPTVRVGVLSGPGPGPDAALPVRWAAEVVNAAGGIGGRPVELVLEDATGGLEAPTRRLAADDGIVAVVGPTATDGLFEAAPALTAAGKVVVTPGAPSTEVARTFGRRPQVWRTAPSDDLAVAGVLAEAAAGGDRTAALLAPTGRDGRWSADGFPLVAADAGLSAAGVHRYPSSGCGGPVAAAVAVAADVLVAVPPTAEAARCTVSTWRGAGGPGRLVLVGLAAGPGEVAALGAAADGVEVVAPAVADGFAAALASRADAPAPAAAASYDALLLLAYGLQRSGGQGGPALEQALAEVTAAGAADGAVSPPGPPTWDVAMVGVALRALAAGQLPPLSGAGGPLHFGSGATTEPIGRGHDRWVAQGGTARPRAPRPAPRPGSTGPVAADPDRTGLWAVLVSTSTGQANARHQADVLAWQALLRGNGVAPERILTVADDLRADPDTPEPGVVRNEVGGPNLLDGATVDLRPDQLDAAGLLYLLAGRPTPSGRAVTSGPGDDVLVVLVGHGDERGLHVGLDRPPGPGDAGPGSVLTPEALGATVDRLHAGGRFRRLLVVADACNSGALGAHVRAPGATLLAAAAADEESEATNQDPATGTWLADELSYELWRQAGADPDLTLGDLGRRLAVEVRGSHVTTFATPGPPPARLRDFVAP